MFELTDSDIARGYINILVTDFVTGFKAIYVSEDAPIQRFAYPRIDIHIVVDAPRNFCAANDAATPVFFIDANAQGRCLSENQFQVIFEGHADDNTGFYQWACECVGFFKVMQFNQGMVCVDFADFLTALGCCKDTTLRFEKLTYDHPATVPYDKHSGRPYRVIYGCLDGGLDQSLWQYTQFTETLQARNPQLVMMKTAMKLTKSTVYSMMLLGEAVD
ncbi:MULTISPECIES: hypothetical protein [Pseudomonas]|uniref:hypothetical protein n=1 Tax=Pseudomonas TaxID=286 RepID=UPI002DBC4154|nr:hypothetical protein [Pseudomonas asiatica]MEB6589155.1 hypothetical protein [Pseudomonas asiatica]